MPRAFTQLMLFLSSPGDLDSDRVAVEAAVAEANKILDVESLFIKTFRWEHDAIPGRGQGDAQAIINKKIRDSTDIFVLLMHSRAGSATNNSLSGTIEEFEVAHELISAGKNIEMCLYFSAEPISPNVDAHQLVVVQEFKRKCQNLSYLTREYNGPSDLRVLLISHLVEKARSFSNINGAISSEFGNSAFERLVCDSEDLSGIEDDDSPGILDYESLALENVNESAGLIVKIGEITAKYTKIMEKDTANIENVYNSVASGINVDKVAPIDRFCDHLEEHLEEIEPVTVKFEESFSRGIEASLGIVQEWPLEDGGDSELEKFVSAMKEVVVAIAMLREQADIIPMQFQKWPGLTRRLKRVRNRGTRIYLRLRDILSISETNMESAISIANRRLGDFRGN